MPINFIRKEGVDKNMKILLFIPMYNCEEQIIRVLAQLNSKIQNYLSEVIIVNNQSTDNGEEAVRNFVSSNLFSIPIKLLRNNQNYGLGGSHKVAFNYAIQNNFDYVIVLHGDDQGNIEDLLPILKREVYKKYDCCLGARFMKGASLQNYSRFRTFGNQVYDFLFSVVCRLHVKDLGSGLNMYSVKMLRDKFYMKFPDDLTFNYCMVMALQYYKQRALFFPISWRESDQISNVKLFSQAKKVLGMLLIYACQPSKFMQKELRNTIHNSYEANVIVQNEVNHITNER